MAGGTWVSPNKIQPGIYINTKTAPGASSSVSNRGIVTIAKELEWGADDTIMEIYQSDDVTPFIGYDITSEKAMFLREIFKGSDTVAGPAKVLLYRLQGSNAQRAATSIGELIVSAKHKGTRGNDITIIVSADPDQDNPQAYYVQTIIDGSIKDTQSITDLTELIANDWVTFEGTGTDITVTIGATLEGGTNGDVSPASYSAYLTALEPHAFNILICDASQATVKGAFVTFIQRMRDANGKKCQLVISEYPGADHESVISVNNGVILSDGTKITAQQATWWLGGTEAGANYNQSLTYAQYPDAIQSYPMLTNSQIDIALLAGEIVFFEEFGRVKVCTDINTLTNYTPDKNKDFRKNRIIRVVDTFCNDVREHFSKYFIGKVDNNEDGRNLFRAWLIGYLNEMQANNGIKNFIAEDVTITAGEDTDSIFVTVCIQPVDSIEKIYLKLAVTRESITAA